MSSSIRLTATGAPEIPPSGYARIFVDYEGDVLYLKMIRPDGSIQAFGTISTPMEISVGGTGTTTEPQVGQFLIGTSSGYRVGDIVAGDGINIVKDDTNFEISTNISNIDIVVPDELTVEKIIDGSVNTFTIEKVSQSQNTVYAGPQSEDGLPSFRFLQVTDIPDLPISKIVNLIETIRAESLLIPTSTDSIEHTYDNTTKVLTSSIKPTGVTEGEYGSASQTLTINVNPEGRIVETSSQNIEISTSQITNFTEDVQDIVGQFANNTDSINVTYDDYENKITFNVNEEHLITTNISDSENTKAPTSQSIKLYVDENLSAERGLRESTDEQLQEEISQAQRNIGIGSGVTYNGHDASNYLKPTDFQNSNLNVNLKNADLLLDTVLKNESEQRQLGDTQTLTDAKEYTDLQIVTLKGQVDAEYDTLQDLQYKIEYIISNADAEALDSLTEIVTAFKNADNSLSGAISSLSTSLLDKINQEKLDRELADNTLQSSISTVSAGLAQELLDRESGDSTLQDNIDTVSTGLAQELLDRASADSALQGEIDTVETNLAQELLDRASADATLQSNIDDVATDLSTETTARQTNDTELDNKISAEKTRAEGIEQELQSDLDTVAANLATEVTDRTSGDETLQSNINTVTENLNTEIANRTTAVNDEKIRAEAEEERLTTAIDTEKTERQAQDQILQGDIDTLSTNLSNEITARENADTGIVGRLNIIEGDSSVVGSIQNAEQNAKTYTDTKISALLDDAPDLLNTLNEIAAAIGDDKDFITTINNAINGVRDQLNAEIDTLKSNDTTHDSDITDLKAKDISHDASITTLNTTVSTLNNSLNTASSSITEIISGTGLQTDGNYDQPTESNYLNDATSLHDANLKLDVQIKTIADDLQAVEAQVGENLQQQISNVTDAISTEKNEREAADQQINSTLNAFFEGASFNFDSLVKIEEQVKAVENLIQNPTQLIESIDNIEQQLVQERSRAKTAETLLQSLISIESDARTSADSSLQTSINQTQSQLDGFLSGAADGISSLSGIQNELTTINNNITQLDVKFESDVTNLQALISIEADARISDIQTVQNLITSIPQIQAKSEVIALTPSIINNAIPLQNVRSLDNILENSMVAFIDRIGLFEELDFNLSNYGSDQVALTFTPDILTILDGTEVLRLKYLVRV